MTPDFRALRYEHPLSPSQHTDIPNSTSISRKPAYGRGDGCQWNCVDGDCESIWGGGCQWSCVDGYCEDIWGGRCQWSCVDGDCEGKWGGGCKWNCVDGNCEDSWLASRTTFRI